MIGRQAPLPGPEVSRRAVLAGAALLWVAAGCSSPSAPPAPPSTTAPAGPRTVAHKYGTTQVPDAPQRIVTVGLVDHDAVLALGSVPVGLTAGEYSADQPHGVWPWAQDKLGGATPEVLPDTEINFERIAALQPDLILAIYSGLTQDEYDRLSQIAPTVAQSGDHADYETPWQDMTLSIGLALGKQEAAEQAIGAVDAKFAELRAAHPEFAGKVGAYGGYYEPGKYYIEKQGSTRVEILTQLGFSYPTDLQGDGFYVDVSQEQASLFDRDAVLWELGDAEAQKEIEADPVYAQLDVHKQGRDLFVTDQTMAGALALISVLSLPYVVDLLAPQLAAAVDGDPGTPVPPA